MTRVTLERDGGHTLVADRTAGPAGAPTVIFCHGFLSDRQGGKALHLEAHCAGQGIGFVRYDAFGHGESSGAMADGTISRWVADGLAVIDRLCAGPVILIGSSMGGWVALRAAVARPDRVAGLMLVAPAPDFTRWGYGASLTPAEQQAMATHGFIERPSAYSPEPTRITRLLLEDGAANLMLDGPIAIDAPVRILHGQQDPDVPWRLALDLVDRITSPDVRLHLLKDGDHRLSRPDDLALMGTTLDELLGRIADRRVAIG